MTTQALISSVARPPTLTVIDVLCGHARTITVLAGELGIHAIGIEIRANYCRIAGERPGLAA